MHKHKEDLVLNCLIMWDYSIIKKNILTKLIFYCIPRYCLIN